MRDEYALKRTGEDVVTYVEPSIGSEVSCNLSAALSESQLRSAKQMKHCLGGYHRHLLRNTASFCLVRSLFEREKLCETSAR